MAPKKMPFVPKIPVPSAGGAGARGRSRSPGAAGTPSRSRSRSGSIPADQAIRAQTPPKSSPSPPHGGVGQPRIPVPDAQRIDLRKHASPPSGTTGNLADQMGMPSVVQHQAPAYVPLQGREQQRASSPIYANAEYGAARTPIKPGILWFNENDERYVSAERYVFSPPSPFEPGRFAPNPGHPMSSPFPKGSNAHTPILFHARIFFNFESN